MAIIENLQKISDTIWELPASYKNGMRVPARIVATEKLVREMDESRRTRSACRNSSSVRCS
jgi:tRNA-splicing ligase RtcB